jgi:hypothetical protein
MTRKNIEGLQTYRERRGLKKFANLLSKPTGIKNMAKLNLPKFKISYSNEVHRCISASDYPLLILFVRTSFVSLLITYIISYYDVIEY